MSKYLTPVELKELNLSPAEIDAFDKKFNINENNSLPMSQLRDYLDRVEHAYREVEEGRAPYCIVTQKNHEAQHEQPAVDRDPYILICGMTAYHIAVQKKSGIKAVLIPYEKIARFAMDNPHSQDQLRKLKIAVDLHIIQHYLHKARIETHMGHIYQVSLEELHEAL